MILGLGVDIVDVARFEAKLANASGLRDRLFTEGERELPVDSLAARFAAKEAFIKAMGGSHDFGWHDLTVPASEGEAPRLELSGAAARLVAERGINSVHLSLSHDGGHAIAFVIAEGGVA